MKRRTATSPEVRVGGFWLSTIVPQGWGELEHSTRLSGSWECSWEIPIVRNWRHPALVYGAAVELCLGPVVLWSGALDEPDWDAGRFVAIGACRDGETAMALDGSGNASTVPNTVIDAAIARGVLSWTRVGDFGTDPVGDANSGLVTIQSVLDAWAQKNDSRWKVNAQRQLVIEPIDETNSKWFILPGSGVLGSAAEERVDRVFVRYIDSATGGRATATFPAATPVGGIEKPVDLTDKGAMTSTRASDEAEAIWNQMQGQSGWTNGWTLTNGQVLTKGGGTADLALIEAGDVVVALGSPDPRGVAHNTSVVLGETSYEWADDEIQANPRGLAARDTEGVLETVGNLAVDAMAAATADRTGDTDWNDLTVDPNPAFANVTAEYRVRDGDVTIRVLGTLNTGSGTTYTPVPAGSIPAGIRPATTANGGAVVGGRVGVIGVLATGAVVLLQDSGVTANGAVSATYTYPIG